jgi:hypothetical protein
MPGRAPRATPRSTGSGPMAARRSWRFSIPTTSGIPTHLAEAVAALDRATISIAATMQGPGFRAVFRTNAGAARGAVRGAAPPATVIDADGPVLGFAAARCATRSRSTTSATPRPCRGARALVRSLRFDPSCAAPARTACSGWSLRLPGARIAISWRCNVTCGTGVNLFFSAHDWNSAATLEKFASQLLFAEKLKRQDICRRRVGFRAAAHPELPARLCVPVRARAAENSAAAAWPRSGASCRTTRFCRCGCRSCSSRCCSTSARPENAFRPSDGGHPRARTKRVQPFEAALRRLADAVILAQMPHARCRQPLQAARGMVAQDGVQRAGRPAASASRADRPALSVETRRART